MIVNDKVCLLTDARKTNFDFTNLLPLCKLIFITLHFIHYYFLNWIYTNTFVLAITVQITFVE